MCVEWKCPELDSLIRIRTKLKLNLSNCATKSDLEKAAGVDTSPFTNKDDLAILKSDVDKLDIDELKIRSTRY